MTTKQLLPWRAPGKASTNGLMTCPCAWWCRDLDRNANEFMHGHADLDHAALCDGHGEPTRPAPSTFSEFARGVR